MGLLFWWAIFRLDEKDRNIVLISYFYVILVLMSLLALLSVEFKVDNYPVLLLIFSVIIIAIIIPIIYVIKKVQDE
jgi:hypothetical protein